MPVFAILIFLLLIGVLVIAHEFGHFFAARRAGMRVDEFGFGFPPRVLGMRRKETVYSINAVPLGGFVKIFGEDGDDRLDPRSFSSKSPWARAIVLAAGVLMNLVLAMALLALGFGIGIPSAIDETTPADVVARDVRVRIASIAPNSPAAESMLRIGDAVVAVKTDDAEIPVATPEDLQNAIEPHAGEPIVLRAERGSETLDIPVTPRVNPPPDEGAVGVGLLQTGIVSYPWYEAIGRGIVETLRLTATIVVLLAIVVRDAVTTGNVAADLAGPVGIATLTAQAADLGFIFVLQLAALLSINLAIINAIPFPALDGGRLLFLAIATAKGSPVSPRVERIAHAAGFALLIGLIVAVTVRDIGRLL